MVLSARFPFQRYLSLLSSSKKWKRRSNFRQILLESLEKRQLMASDVSTAFSIGLSQANSSVDQYVGFGLPARPYSEAELRLNLGVGEKIVGPQQLVWIADTVHTEEGGSIRFNVRRSGTAESLAVGYRIDAKSSASPAHDFELSSGLVQFEVGQDLSSVVFKTVDDLIHEQTETVELQLMKIGSSQISVTTSSSIAQIYDNDLLTEESIFGFALSLEANQNIEGQKSLSVVRTTASLSRAETAWISLTPSSEVNVQGRTLSAGSTTVVPVFFASGQDVSVLNITAVNQVGVAEFSVLVDAAIVPDSSYRVDVANKEVIRFERAQRPILDQVTAYATDVRDRPEGVVDLSKIAVDSGFVYLDTNLDGVIDQSIDVSQSKSQVWFPLTPTSSTSDSIHVSFAYSFANESSLRIEDWRRIDSTLPALQSIGQLRLDGVVLLSDTGASNDGKSSNPTITGSVLGLLTQSNVYIEFDHDSDGIAEAQVFVSPQNRTFTYDPRTIDSTFGSINSVHKIDYRIAGANTWNSVTIELEALPDSRLSIGDFLFDYRPGYDTAFVSGLVQAPQDYSDRSIVPSTSIAGLRAQTERSGYSNFGETTQNDVQATNLPLINEINPNAGLIAVEIDVDGDERTDRVIRIDGDMTFRASLPELISGAHWVGMRVSEWSPQIGDRIHSQWSRYFVDLGEQFPALQQLTFVPSVDGIAAPIVSGILAERGRVDVIESRVDVDWDLDGIVDESVVPSVNGEFRFVVPTNISGAKAIAVRTGLLGGNSSSDFDSWYSFSFDSTSSVFPYVSSISIANASDPSSIRGTSIDFIGRISTVTSDDLRIEFDSNQDERPDAVTTAQGDGQFYFQLNGIGYGTHTIAYRTSGWNSQLRQAYDSPWQEMLYTNSPPVIVQNPISEANGEPGDSNGMLTFPVEIVGSVFPDYSSVEVDWSGDSTAETVVSVANREFSVAKSQIPSGTVQLLARGVASSDSGSVFGSWVTIPIADWTNGGWPALVTGLKLLSDSGEEYSDGKTENTTIVGAVFLKDAQSLEGIKVQIDENNDGIPDGMTTSDRSGGFFFQPAFLPVGNSTVRFRAVQWSNSQSSYRVSPWSSISFLFEDQIDGPARIRSVGKTTPAPTGNSNAELQTTVSGRITNESELLGVVIEIDINNDDTGEQIVSTDRFGRFSTALIGTSTQIDALRVRTRELDPISRTTQYGPWVVVTTAPGGDGDGGENDEGGDDGSDSGNASGNGFEGADPTGGDGQYQSEIASANVAHKAALDIAKQSYNVQLASADAVYAAAIAAAGANFQSLLSNFSGDSSSFRYTPFVWPQSPTSGTEFPSDPSLPTPPLQKPTYSGPDFDYSSDAVYQSEINSNRATYQAEVAAAKTALSAAKSAAEQAHQARVQAINADYEQSVSEANDKFDDDSEVDDSALDALAAAFQAAIDAAWSAYTAAAQALASDLNTSITAAWNTLQSQIQSASDAYNNAVESAAQSYSSATNHDGCTCDEERTASISYSQAVYAAGKTYDKAVSSARNGYDHTVAGLLKGHAYAMADLWAVYQSAIIDAQDEYDRGKIEFDSEVANQLADAAHDFGNSINDLATDRDKLIADSERLMAIDIASAEKAYTLRIETAKTVLWKSDAVSKRDAIGRWNTSVNTDWTAFQLSIRNNEVAYYNQLAIEHLEYTSDVANAEYDRQVARANAQRDYRYAMIDAEHARKLQKNDSSYDLANANNANATSNAEADADDRKSMRQGQNDPAYVKAGADAAYAYAIAVSDANHEYVTSMADARQFVVTANTCENRTADRRYPWSWSVVFVPFSSAATIYNTFVKALNQAQYDFGVANIENGNFANSALSDLWDNYQDAKRDRDTASANTAASDNRDYQDDQSQADHDFAIEAMKAQGSRSKSFSNSDLTYTTIVTPESSEYERDKVNLLGTRNNNDASSSKSFKLTSANRYATAMGAFNSSQSTPWSAYHQQLGTIEIAWATASGNIEVNYVSTAGTTDSQFTVTTTALDATRVVNNATADNVYVTASVNARNAYAVSAGAAKLARAKSQSANTEESAQNQNDNANENASARSSRESGQAATLRDAEKAFQLAMLAAQLALANASADASTAYAIASGNAWESYFNESIDYQGYLDALEAANDAYNDAMEDAYDAFNAAAKAAWDTLKAAYADALRDDMKGDAGDANDAAHDDADERDRFAGDELASAIAEAAALRAAAIVLATATAAANKTSAATIAENERVFAFAVATANKTKADAMVSLEATKRQSEYIANAAQREDAIAARGMYEVNVYTNMSSTISSQTAYLGTSLANYRSAVATAEAVRANLVRVAKDAFEDAISMAGLAEVQSTNAANIARRNAVGNAEVVYAQNMAAADKGQTIAYANNYYELYLANATAEAGLREVLLVSAATKARENVGTESDRSNAIADAELARANAVADALHALQTAFNADWVPIEWNGWGYGGWGYGWGGWYGGWGGWYGGWGGWYGWGGYVFGYANYGWGGYGYGGFGGWNGFGWGFGTWYGGWYGGLGGGYGWGYGGNYGGDHGDDQDDYNDAVDQANEDFNDSVDDANSIADDEKAATKLAEAIRNGNAGIAFASARGTAGVAYVLAMNSADDANAISSTAANDLLSTVVNQAERTWTIAVSNAKIVRVSAENSATSSLSVATANATASLSQTSAQAEASFHLANALLAQQRAQQSGTGLVATYAKGYAEGFANWILNVSPAFVSMKGTQANVSGTLSVEVQNAFATKSNAKALAEHVQIVANAATSGAYVSASQGINNTVSSGFRTLENARSHAHALNMKTFEISAATNAKTSQVAIAQAGVDFDEDSEEHEQAVKNAKKNGAIQFAVLSHDYSLAEHGQRKAFTLPRAEAERNHTLALENLESAKNIAVANAERTKKIAISAAEKTYWTTESVQRNTATQGHSNSLSAMYSATEAALVGANTIINAKVQLPWTQYLVTAAHARVAAWTASASAYLQMTSARNTLESAYDSNVAIGRQNRSTTTIEADYAAAVAKSSATKLANIAKANAKYAYDTQLSGNAEIFLNRLTEIKKNEEIERANNPSGPASDWQSQKSAALIVYANAQNQAQSTARSSYAASEVGEESSFTNASATYARIEADADSNYRELEATAYSTVIAGMRYQERLYTQTEASAVLSATNSIASSSPWASYDAMEGAARNSWRNTVGSLREAKDSQLAIVQRQLEQAVSATDSSFLNRRIDYVESLKLAIAGAPPVYVADVPTPPTPSFAPSIDSFYASISSGILPPEIAKGFTPTGAGTFSVSSGSLNGIGGGGYGSYGGTSILNPNGTSTGYGGSGGGNSGYGGYGGNSGYGSYGANGDSPTTRVNWDFIAEADAIQSTENTDSVIAQYRISTDGLFSIFDFEDQQSTAGYGGGSGGYGSGGYGSGGSSGGYGSGGNGSGGYVGESEPPLGDGEPLVFDFTSTNEISEIIGERSPELQRLFEASASARFSSLPMRPLATPFPTMFSPSAVTNSPDRARSKPSISLLRNNEFSFEAHTNALEAAQEFESSLNLELKVSPNSIIDPAFSLDEPELVISESDANTLVEYENMLAELSSKLAGLSELSPSQMSQFESAGLTAKDPAGWFTSELKVVRVGDTNYTYLFHQGGYIPPSGPYGTGYTYYAKWTLEKVTNSSQRIDKALFQEIRDNGYLSAYQTTEVLISILPGGSTATYIEDGKYGRAGLAFVSDVAQFAFPIAKLAKLQKLASATSKLTKANVAISAKTMAATMLIVDSLNAGVSLQGTIEDIQKGNKVAAAIGSLDVLFSVLNVGFSAKRFAEAAGDARRVVEKATPEIDASQPKLASNGSHLPIVDLPQLCFKRDTLVATERGLRPIGEIEPGDKVFGYDFENGRPTLAEVETRHDNLYDGAVVRIEVNGTWVETTVYHPFWVMEGRDLDERSVPRELDPSEDEGKALQGRWVNSHELRAGDTIHLQNGTSARVTRIEQRYESLLPVSNLTVRGFHTFFVGKESILVHNISWCEVRKSIENTYRDAIPKLSEERIIELTHVEARRIARAKSSYVDVLESHVTDALGNVRPHGKGEFAIDPLTGEMKKWHAHHIVRKDGDANSDRAQELLVEYGFDPYFGKECMVWAPNRGHTDVAESKAANAIIDVVSKGLADGETFKKIRSRLQVALKTQGQAFIDGVGIYQ